MNDNDTPNYLISNSADNAYHIHCCIKPIMNFSGRLILTLSSSDLDDSADDS